MEIMVIVWKCGWGIVGVMAVLAVAVGLIGKLFV